ncbi:4-hydroxy-tetrahydrodipicolinate reductase [Methanobrevibacter cuticularis]|uniref:4-hydroxy-tetrahydrodipicolinate reductase n=1 Tax=Methanobrevibacter cuticularis TaxID=47311 RepID=A0A166F7F2_9EURY|nr:4-hydroxy-tetrahydrodipicolinate reductase [Methanobrevibacter cuticularis]KZX17393.1 4-hydroxy-tetrahydrodipicolinate reductase [Methanobrevibacter cuticularis]
MLKVAVTGAGGRMGSGIIKKIVEQEDMKLVAAIEIPNTQLQGKDIGEVIGIGSIGVDVNGAEKLEDILKSAKPDVLVDFTIASAAFESIKTAANMGVNLVVGTTGFTEEQSNEINDIIRKTNVKSVISSNMAIGVNVFFKILKDLAPVLDDFDIEIIEAHHNKKKDAPSGTAMTAFEVIAKELDRNTEEVGIFGREGIVGERTKKEIGLHAIRGGDIVGDHTVMFVGEGERLEITHRAHTREVFIAGVMRALKFVSSGEPGKVHDMADVLGIK